MPEQEQQISNFIPDSIPTSDVPVDSADSGVSGMSDILFLISIVLLALSLAMAAGVYLFLNYETKRVADKQNQLNIFKNGIKSKDMEVLKLLSDRLKFGQSILNSHIAVTRLFKALELHTLKSVQFTKFGFSKTPEGLNMMLEGRALTVNAVAAQSKEFSKNKKALKNIIFSNLGFEKDGTVKFKVVADVNPDFVNFTSAVLEDRQNSGGGAVQGAVDNTTFGQPASTGLQGQNRQNTNTQGTGQTDSFGNPI